MGIRYDVVMTLPPSGNGQRTRLALQHGDDGIARPAVLRMLMEGVTPFSAAASGDVLGLIDVITLEGARWGVFELVPGVTLRELVEVHRVAKRLPALGLSGRVVVDAAKAIGALHRQSPVVAHGGLSDAALLAGFDGVTSVLDLGAPRSSRMMAPEQLRGAPATPTTDVFCLGAALHAAITGYDGPYASVVTAGLDTLPWKHAEGSPALDQVLREALHPAPNMRWPDAIAFAEQLESVLAQDLIGKDALSGVLKTLFKDRQAALRDAVDQRRGGAPAPRPSRASMTPRSSGNLPIVSAVVDAAPPVPAPRPSIKSVKLPEWPADLPDDESGPDQKTEVRGLNIEPPGAESPNSNPPTVSLRPRPSISKPPRSSPSKPPPKVVQIEEAPVDLGEIDDVPTGASHEAIIDDSDLSHVPEAPALSEHTDFDPGATTPGHKLKVPVPNNFDVDPPRRLSTGLQLKMQTEEEKEAARGQEKISTADLDPDERDDGLGGEITDEPTNVRARPKLTSDSMDALPVEPGIDDVEGDPTAPPKRMPEVLDSAADLEAAGAKKKGGAARLVIALLLLVIAGSSGYVVLMRPDLVAQVKARVAALRGQPAPVPEDLGVDLDAGVTLDADGGEAAVPVPAPLDLDAGEAPDAGTAPAADAGEPDDAGLEDAGVEEDDEAADAGAKDAGAKDSKANKKSKKKRRR
ncbi:MAG: hypothetical protein QM723_04310 [Myxococcaceae bacterium]